MQNSAASFRERAENIVTKPLQPDLPRAGSHLPIKKKNPGSVATETRIKFKVKASSFPLCPTPNLDVEAICNQDGRGNCYDNAVVETFFKTVKAELIWQAPLRDTRRQCKLTLL